MHQPAHDLFGEIPVTEDEIFDYVLAVAPQYLSAEFRFNSYVRSYDVPGKIRAAKLRGTFYETIDQPRNAWHARLALSAVL